MQDGAIRNAQDRRRAPEPDPVYQESRMPLKKYKTTAGRPYFPMVRNSEVEAEELASFLQDLPPLDGLNSSSGGISSTHTSAMYIHCNNSLGINPAMHGSHHQVGDFQLGQQTELSSSSGNQVNSSSNTVTGEQARTRTRSPRHGSDGRPRASSLGGRRAGT